MVQQLKCKKICFKDPVILADSRINILPETVTGKPCIKVFDRTKALHQIRQIVGLSDKGPEICHDSVDFSCREIIDIHTDKQNRYKNNNQKYFNNRIT